MNKLLMCMLGNLHVFSQVVKKLLRINFKLKRMKSELLLCTSPLCLVTSFWMVLSTGVTGGGGGGSLVGATGLGGM